MKKVNLHIIFYKKWILKTTSQTEDTIGAYLKKVLKNKITVNNNNRITSLFNIHINANFCWLILDSKNNLLTLNSKVPKKVIIIGIDLKQFYAKIVNLMHTKQIRMINAYIKELYGYNLYKDIIEDEIEVKPLEEKIVKEIIKPAILLEEVKKDVKETKPKPIIKRKEPKNISKNEKADLQPAEIKDENKPKENSKNKKVTPKEVVNQTQKEKEEKPKVKAETTKQDKQLKSIDDKPVTTNNDDEIDMPKVEPKAKNKNEEKKVDNIKKKKEQLSDNNLAKTTELKKEPKLINKPIEEKKEKKKKQDEKLKKDNKKKSLSEPKEEEKPKEIQIVLTLNNQDDNKKTNNNKNTNRLAVVTPIEDDNNEKTVETDISNRLEPNVQKITFTVVLPNGQLLYNKVILNSSPMTVVELLKKTGLPIKDDLGFIESIAGINNQGMSGWVYEVNGSPIMISASDYVVNPEDEITWKYVNFAPIDLPLEEEQKFEMEEFVEEPVGKKMR